MLIPDEFRQFIDGNVEFGANRRDVSMQQLLKGILPLHAAQPLHHESIVSGQNSKQMKARLGRLEALSTSRRRLRETRVIGHCLAWRLVSRSGLASTYADKETSMVPSVGNKMESAPPSIV